MSKEYEAPNWLLLARQTLVDDYAIDGDLSRLPGENRNYRVETGRGKRYVLKIVAGAEAAEGIQVESEIMAYAADHGFTAQLPTIISNSKGSIVTRMSGPHGGLHCAQLMEFVEGELWEDRPDISRCHLQSLGRVMAQFNRALEGFDHPRLHRGHLWDITRAEQHFDKIRLIADGGTKRLVESALQQWGREARPLFDHLPRQVIHGDLNLENVFVTGDEVSGLVDYTDCCFNPTVSELAICLAYVMMDQQDPFAGAAAVIDGYQSVRPLSENELRILPTLICARLAITLCVSAWRRTIDPDHPTWYVSEANAGILLREVGSATWGRNPLSRFGI